MSKKLYVGFKGNNNSSHKLVENLKGEKCFLTNSFSGLKKDIDSEYDIVYMFGLDKNLKDSIKIDKYAKQNNNIIKTEVDISDITKRLDRYRIK